MKITGREHVVGFMFIAPLLLLFAVFLVYGFYFIVNASFYDQTLSFRDATFVGWDNYVTALSDDRFLRSIANNLAYSAAAIVISLSVGFLVSVVLSMGIRGSKLLGSLFFIPSFMPLALIAMVFSIMLEFRFGTLNQLLHGIGLDFLAQRWLSDPTLAYMSIISISVFLIGLPMMYYNADMTTINAGILEAAVIDGAGLGRMLWNVMFPLLKNAHKTIILSTLLGSFREFERVFLLTQGGPAGTTENSSVYIYSFARSAGANIGYVCAASVIVLLIALGISVIQLIAYRPRTGKGGRA
ncbi:sugar ABC transporter permease [Paenibacillus sp. LHD-117]|uniref:carbohydrate ABC transporter permease n=1 Tax=Paenibacillus sp. LHD-117 TaxID=3071412 RepID=UPI0027E0D0E4|nr:sugar ABC transporter permease [Paenibacillus sp. LHD-117]MDQ6421481.1 sugar ABC transporter permease [Paenibacillus sp. LHD-117]